MKKKKKSSIKKETPPQTLDCHKTYSCWYYIIPPSFLAILTAVFYSRSLTYEFQFDSVANITKHFAIRHQSLKNLFLQGPRWISYWMNSLYYSIDKFNPFFYRLGNLLIHIASGLLVFFILFLGLKHLKKQTFFSRNSFSIAFFTAILFLLHPVQTQTISYVIQGQLEGLAALFILSIILCFFMRAHATSKIGRAFLTVLLFSLAILSCGTKEIAIISPALLLLFDWFFIAQGNWQSLKKRLLLHATLTVLIFGVYLYFLKPTFFTDILGFKKIAKNNIGNVITQNPKMMITPWVFFRSQFKVILHYLWMFIWPFDISVEYDWTLSRGILYPDAFFPLFVLLGITAIVFRLLKKNKTHLVSFGFLWFGFCLAPRSSIIPSPELLVDYKTYLASFGWLFLIASAFVWTAQYVLQKIKTAPPVLSTKRYGVETFAVILALVLGGLTMQRNTVWRSGIEFWGNILKNAPGKARAYNNYGVELSQNKKDYEGSIPYFKKAISMDKNYPDPLNNLAVAYSHLKRIDDAIKALSQSLRINRYYPEGYNNLASFYIQKNELEKAEHCLRIALKLRPHYGKAHFNTGRIHLKRKEKEKAWECFKNACTKADFDIEFGFSIYGQTSMELKKYDDAIFAYKKMLQFQPDNLSTVFKLANAYFLGENYREAEKIYQHILTKKPNDIKALYNLGETYFNLKEYQNALAHYKKTYFMKDHLPYIQVRMAHCFERIGKLHEAKIMVERFLREDHKKGDPNILAQLKQTAQKILANMNARRYGGTIRKTV